MKPWPQLIYLILALIGLGITISRHGQPKTGNENGWAAFLGTALVVALLSWGGFFDGVFR